MKKQPDRNQSEMMAIELHRLRETPMAKEIADVEALPPEFYLEPLELDGRDYHTPFALAEAWCDLGWQIPYEDMNESKRRQLWTALFDTLGAEPNRQSIDQYTWEVPQGEPLAGTATVDVIPTREARLAIHRITYSNGLVEYAVGWSSRSP